MVKRISFPSRIENIHHVEMLINDFFQNNNLDTDFKENVFLVVSEAVINAIIHGNKLNPNKIVSVYFESTTEKIIFIISDEGNGFDFVNLKDPTEPENIDKPNGRGIFLMINLADRVEFSNAGKTVKIEFNTRFSS